MEKNLEYKINKKIENIIKLLMIFSCPALTTVLSSRFQINEAILGAYISLFIIIFIVGKLEIKSIHKKIAILSLIIACYMMRNFFVFLKEKILYLSDLLFPSISLDISYNMIKVLWGVAALPALTFFVYVFIKKMIPEVKKFFINLTKIEKKYLFIMFWVAVFLSIFITNTTTAFSKPYINGKYIKYDVIYTSDSGSLTLEDAYFNISHKENDIRQPIFGVFALPFSVLAKIISELVFFFPEGYAYEGVMTIIQFILTTISTILIARLMNLNEDDKPYLYLLFSFSFPYLLFNLVLEQYVIGLFYLILTIYCFYNYEGINYTYIGATGTLITSGILFPFITKFKNIKQYIKDIFKCFLVFVSVFVISGQLPQILTLSEKITDLSAFAEPLSLSNKMYQFSNFIRAIFISAPGEIAEGWAYRLVLPQSISIIGIIILGIVLISVIINRKEKMAKISGLWILLSIFVLVIVGWGTTENGLILYSLYFSWAYLCLYYLFLRKLFKNNNVFNTLLLITIFVMIFFNIRELINIVMFAIKYY